MLTGSSRPRVRRAEDICLTCGLCCDGTIFSDVKLVASDDIALLRSLGLTVLREGDNQPRPAGPGRAASRFLQPCSALEGCRCHIYGSRPGHCRAFECLLLKKVKERSVTRAEALRLIRAARGRAQKVRKLLRALGDVDETIALPDRFRRTTKRLQRAQLDRPTAAVYGRLTLAFHDLMLLINQAFYRSPAS